MALMYSAHFSEAEMRVTSTGIPNVPDPDSDANLRRLCRMFLEPLRAHVGPIVVTSGYRCKAVNYAIGGSSSSAHMHGRAADIYAPGVDLVYLWAAIRNCDTTGLPGFTAHVDQAIYYVRPKGTGWIHLGIPKAGCAPRGQYLIETGGKYLDNATYRGPWYG